MEIIASLDKVSYFYPNSQKPVLKNISLNIRKGEFLGIIGPTGSGKTTLCLTLNGIIPQFYGGRFFGYIKVAGLDTLEYPVSHLSRYIGSVFEDPETQLLSTSVINEIAFALENLCIKREEIITSISSALTAVRLEGMENKHPQELSGGQKQRLAIAAAIALKPKLLILDEPTSQLDPIGSQEVFSTVRKLNKELGITIIMVSHASEEMAQFSDRLALLSDGKIIKTGTPEEIYTQIPLLESHNLRPPEVAKIFYGIRRKGINFSQVPVTLEQGIKTLRELKNNIVIPTTPKKSDRMHENNLVPLLSTRNLTYCYENNIKVLDKISLDIFSGEYVLIAGQNGSGKSTLVKHFLNLLQPTQGTVKVKNKDTQTLSISDISRIIGYVGQNPDNQIFNMTVKDEIIFALNNLGYGKRQIDNKVYKILEDIGLLEFSQAHPFSLAKGDRARIIIAAILAMETDIIIFDEPTTGQDYKGACSILEITRKLHQAGKTIVVITHHLYLMSNYAERVILLKEGKMILDASIDEAYHKVELLKSTYLVPPQTVLLTQEMNRNIQNKYPALTPNQMIKCFSSYEI
ncbi:MAG: ATP-binding cassette domain-containing protein [Candidatus Atelocyanobacterium thalassa]